MTHPHSPPRLSLRLVRTVVALPVFLADCLKVSKFNNSKRRNPDSSDPDTGRNGGGVGVGVLGDDHFWRTPWRTDRIKKEATLRFFVVVSCPKSLFFFFFFFFQSRNTNGFGAVTSPDGRKRSEPMWVTWWSQPR